MNRILDTNVCIDVLRGRKKVTERLAACQRTECYLSVITEFELFLGARRAPSDRRDEETAKVSRFLEAFHILPFPSECARIAAEIHADLLNKGTPVGITDVFIAATGIHHQWTVVTNNTRDFSKIEGLTLEDWR